MGWIRRQVLVSCVQFDDELKQGAMSVLEVAPIAKRLGADGVEYREVYWRNKQEELPAIRAQLAELGMMATYATFTPLQNGDEAGREQLLTDIEDAAALGSPLLRVFRGPNPDPGKEAEVFGAAEAAIGRATGLGITLVLENHIGALGNKLADVLEAVERFAPLGLKVNVDTSNYVLNGQGLIKAIRILSPLIAYSHLKDVKIAPDGRSATYLGDGNLDFAAILSEYNLTGREFPVCFEFRGEGDPEGRIAKSMAHVRSIWEEVI